ncbi:MAG: hypothetical protein MJ248_06840 [Bacilli bacterium]|nr:hypothetical protein [Bacilli bacterium]
MKQPTIATLKKYLAAMMKIKKKYVTSDRLSKVVGVYPEVINETFSYFDPMVNMDYEYNLMELVPQIKDYIEGIEEEKAKAKASKPAIQRNVVRKNDVSKYESVGDFIYQKMTIGGMLDKYITLTDSDLKILKKLVIEEQASRKKKK